METLATLTKDFPLAVLRSFLPRLRSILPQLMMFAPMFGMDLTEEQSAALVTALTTTAVGIVDRVLPGTVIEVTIDGAPAIRLVAK